MEKEIALEWGTEIINNNAIGKGGLIAEIKELIKGYCGKNNSFYEEINKIPHNWSSTATNNVARSILISFINTLKKDLISGISIERRIQNEVVSDFLEQAIELLNNPKIHAAAPAVIIGAALEEFLRNWIEEEDLSTTDKKYTLDSYAKILRGNELITKQDIKDITSWTGIRNDAAHGNWNSVEDKDRIKLMLEGVNLFIRKYSE